MTSLKVWDFIHLSVLQWGGGISCVSEGPSEPLCIENISNETCTVNLYKEDFDDSLNIITLEYSYDKSTWTTFTDSDGIGSFEIPANSKAYVKGDNSTFSTVSQEHMYYEEYRFYGFRFDKQCNISGEIRSLIGGTNTIDEFMFYMLFANNTNIVSAENLILPNIANNNSYSRMFYNCRSLSTAPKTLPATTLASYCYQNMFYGCTSLTTAPELPATTLADGCYYHMFYGCTLLTSAPELPATTLAEECYSHMFYGCTSLTNAPELPATELANCCYSSMFYGCTNLNYIKAMFLTEPSSTYTSYWLSGVSSSGTFVKNAAATWNVTGTSGIPEGWTVETAVA